MYCVIPQSHPMVTPKDLSRITTSSVCNFQMKHQLRLLLAARMRCERTTRRARAAHNQCSVHVLCWSAKIESAKPA